MEESEGAQNIDGLKNENDSDVDNPSYFKGFESPEAFSAVLCLSFFIFLTSVFYLSLSYFHFVSLVI